MKSKGFSILVGLMIWVGMLCGQTAEQVFVPGKLFLKIRNGSNMELPQFRAGDAFPEIPQSPGLKQILSEYGTKALFKPFKTKAEVLQKTYEIHFDAAKDAQGLIAALEALPFVEYAEPIAVHRMHYTPNDQNFLQWHLNKISAPAAWDICRGSRRVVVAIVDDAVRMDHVDLAAQIWTNPNEIPGDSIDNDGNGWIDDVNGYDLAEDDNDPSPPAGASNSNFTHGTHVAGIAAASTDNGVGIASIGFNVSILPCKVKLDSTIGDPELQYTYYGVDYAIATKADVVNMSFGGTGYNATFANLLSVGRDSGLVFVASAGNTGSYSIQYPAGYPDAISVASTGSSDALSGFSTYHPSVDVSAPGSNIYSTVAGTTTSYSMMSGTSMSAPVVTGLVALMASLDSTATPATLRNCLESTTDNINAQNSDKLGSFGTGRVNAQRALQCLVPVSVGEGTGLGFSVNPPYPNPGIGAFTVDVELPFDGHLKARLFDILGREHAILADTGFPAGRLTLTHTGRLAKGVYCLVVEFGGERKSLRILVQD